jgi:hypothetical protein
LTFSYNVTIGIPVYVEIAQIIRRAWAVGSPCGSAAGPAGGCAARFRRAFNHEIAN